MHYGLTVSFIDAANGTTRRLALPEGKTLDVRIPPGTEDGHMLRLRGQGGPGIGGAPAGDALIEITVAPDPQFHREGDDIIVDLPVTLQEAVLGAPAGADRSRSGAPDIPPGSGTGTRCGCADGAFGAAISSFSSRWWSRPAMNPSWRRSSKTGRPANEFNPREGS